MLNATILNWRLKLSLILKMGQFTSKMTMSGRIRRVVAMNIPGDIASWVDNFICNIITKNWFAMLNVTSLNWRLKLSLIMKMGQFTRKKTMSGRIRMVVAMDILGDIAS